MHVLLYNSKQNITSLSLLVGTTVHNKVGFNKVGFNEDSTQSKHMIIPHILIDIHRLVVTYAGISYMKPRHVYVCNKVKSTCLSIFVYMYFLCCCAVGVQIFSICVPPQMCTCKASGYLRGLWGLW